jgi:hypothetical protein
MGLKYCNAHAHYRELEHQNMSLKERLLVARNQLMGGPAKNRRYAFGNFSIFF